MSTLKLKKEPLNGVAVAAEPVMQHFTEEQLRAMLADIEAKKPPPAHVVADKATLPPVDERSSAPVQAPPKLWGVHDPRLMPASPVANLNPATGFPNNQVVAPSRGGSISPPPTKNFR